MSTIFKHSSKHYFSAVLLVLFRNFFSSADLFLRAFLSYDIEDASFLESVRTLQQELLATVADLKLVSPEILHFTIWFLGEIDETDKAEIISLLRGRVEDFELNTTFRGLGTFPNDRRISVVWIGIDPASRESLESHANKVNELLKSVHTLRPVDDEKFSPHITIARVRSGRDKEALIDFVGKVKNRDFGSSQVRNLRLKLSTLKPSGPEYSDLHVFEKQ